MWNVVEDRDIGIDPLICKIIGSILPYLSFLGDLIIGGRSVTQKTRQVFPQNEIYHLPPLFPDIDPCRYSAGEDVDGLI